MTTTGTSSLRWIAAGGALLAGGAAVGYWWAHRTMSDRAAESAADSAAPANPTGAREGKRRILYWHDPMVPNVKFDKPGKSPFMDMQLVPVHADDAQTGGDVRIRPNVAQSLGIRIGKVEKATFTPRLTAVGSVAYDERLLEFVQARVEGYVTRLYVKAPLERVRRGARLAEIQAPAWLEAQQEYLALLDAQSERGRAVRDAARERLRVLGVPETRIRDIETQRRSLATTTIVAPIDGVVTELGVRDGAAFMAGTLLFRINGLGSVWVNAQIPEAQLSMVPTGSTVEARPTAWPGATIRGRVIALLPEVDRETRTLTARVELQNPDDKLSPGMFVALDFSGPASEAQLVVPSEAVIMTGERSVVIVAGEDGTFDVVNVAVGAEQDGRTAVLSGLEEGQSIVLSGQFLIDSEANLKSTVGRLEAVAPAEAEKQP